MAKLYFYYGVMGARKTAEAIMTAYNYEERGMKPLCMSPSIDTRSGIGKWKSRIGLERKVDHVIYEDTNLYNLVNGLLYHGVSVDVIIIDEAQFLKDHHIWELARIVDNLKIPVLCYGLRTDFRGNLFEGSYRLMAIADKLSEIKTMTKDRGKEVKALMNARVVDGKMTFQGAQVEVGGDEKYISLSRKQWMELRVD